MKLPIWRVKRPKWLAQTLYDQPWTVYTAAAGIGLILSAAVAGSAAGILLFLDVASDVLALVLISRYGREPKPGEPDYVPRVTGRRRSAVTLGVLAAVVGATLGKSTADLSDKYKAFNRFRVTGDLAPLVPQEHWKVWLLIAFTVITVLLLGKALHSAVCRRPRESVFLGTRMTLKINLYTGALYGAFQMIVIAAGSLRPAIPGLSTNASLQITTATPLILFLADVLLTMALAIYIIRCNTGGILQLWGPLVGQSAPGHVTLSLRRTLDSLPGVKSIKSLSIVEIGPADADVNAEIDLDGKASLAYVEAELSRCVEEAADIWRLAASSEDPRHIMHLRIDWRRNGKPITRFASVVETVNSIMPSRSSDAVAIMHYTSSSGRTIDPGILAVLQDEGLSLDPHIDLDTAHCADDWDSVVDLQERTANSTKSSTAYRKQKILYFGLADIPETIHLGYLLGNARPIEIYQHDMNTTAWKSPDEVPSTADRFFSIQEDLANLREDYVGPVAVKIELSSRIPDDDVKAVLGDETPIVSVSVNSPVRGMLLSRQEFAELAGNLNRALDRVADIPTRQSIHLFCSTPCGASFQVGRQINTRMFGNISVYFYDRNQSPRYREAMVLRETPLS